MTLKNQIMKLQTYKIFEDEATVYVERDDVLKLLEQQTCVDTISREKVFEQISCWVNSGEYRYTNATYYLTRRIQGISSVTPKGETITEFADRCRECGKMRKGHWIYDKTFENWRCSKCNESPKTLGYVGTADFMAEHFKFCNHCGAKMVEPQESESDD